MATSEKGKLGQRTVRSCAVNSLVFSGSRASVASSSSSSDNRKRPCSVGFSGGLLPLSAPSHSPPYLAPSNNVPPCHAPPSYAQSNSRPLSESPRTAVGSVYRTRHLHHHQQRNQQPQNLQARSKSAPSGNGDLAVPVTGDRGTTYCWITDTDIRSNCTKEAAGRFYKHTYGTDRCSSIKVNFPAAGRFVDNHKLNSKRMGYVRWSDTSKTLTGSKLLERLHNLDTNRHAHCEQISLRQRPYQSSDESNECLYTKVAQSIGIFKRIPDPNSKKMHFHGNEADTELLEMVADCNALSTSSKPLV